MKYPDGDTVLARQFLIDFTAPVEIPGCAGSGRSYGFECTAERFAAMEIVRLRARTAVAEALKSGRLVKPSNCSGCLSAERLSSLHEDYSRPLEVSWLCTRCHNRRTRELAAKARASLPDLHHTPGFKGTPSWALRAIRKSEKEGRYVSVAAVAFRGDIGRLLPVAGAGPSDTGRSGGRGLGRPALPPGGSSSHRGAPRPPERAPIADGQLTA